MELAVFSQKTEEIKKILSRQLFFVIGAQKSGTTWLQKILDAHPEIQCSGEGHFVDDLSIELAQVFKKYNNKLFLVADRVYEGKGYYSPINQEEFDWITIMAIALMFNKRPLAPQIKCIGDKTPANTLHLESLERLFPQAKYIHIVRDGRDVVISHIYHMQRVMRQKKISGVEKVSLANNLETSAKQWVTFVSAAAEFTSKVGINKVKTIRYEDLLEKPIEVIGSMCEFLGVAAKDEIVKNCELQANFEKLTGRQAGEEDTESFFRKGIVGDWQNHLNTESKAKMEAIAGVWLKWFGYT